MQPMTSGVCHFILGKIAIIDRMQANKGNMPFNIRIPKPRITADVKPSKTLDRLETIVEGSCVSIKIIKEKVNMDVNTDTKSITLDRS
ncbi:hypothetical protein PUN28_016273 [Cardiocondyla obscurior]|uniref:Uncharacterized protein n=1 Tax=Cardiocondyla obscurior TaxID=286306 RepID=A0AAW2EWN9_9HYME